MNYRSKKISMKEQLDEAIEEIGSEPLPSSRVQRETREEGLAKSNLMLPSLASRTFSLQSEPGIGPFKLWVYRRWSAEPRTSSCRRRDLGRVLGLLLEAHKAQNRHS
jgi:hypothetical protein